MLYAERGVKTSWGLYSLGWDLALQKKKKKIPNGMLRTPVKVMYNDL